MPLQCTPAKFELLFWTRVSKSPRRDGCWNWTGRKNERGHGLIYYEGKQQTSHFVLWKMINGSIPDEKCVLNICDNPACVRPAHLFLAPCPPAFDDLSQSQPTRRKKARWTKLTYAAVQAIRTRHITDNLSQHQLAEEFNVSRQTIAAILRFKIWKNVPPEFMVDVHTARQSLSISGMPVIKSE